MEKDKQLICQQIQQCSNVAAMVAAASIAAIFFNGAVITGVLLGIYSMYMSLKLLKLKRKFEKEK